MGGRQAIWSLVAITWVATTMTTTTTLAWAPLATTPRHGLLLPTTTTRLAVTTESVTEDDTTTATNGRITLDKLSTPPFQRIMAANRAEISVRIQRAATELNAGTVAIYVHEDRYSQHRT